MGAIEVNNFKKKYDETEAVKGISLTIEDGELFGLIGPDGAGKTTLMRAICTLLVPDEGSILVRGMDVTKNITDIRAILGYMPQRFSLYQDLTVAQNLRFFADLFQVPIEEQEKRLSELYRFSRLEPFKNRLAGALSGGMKQKLALSCALIHTPDILVLDEPTFGVDPVSRDEFWQILHTIRNKGTTILVSTAYMDEANQCDRVALFFDGKIQSINKPDTLRAQFKYPLFQIQAQNMNQIITLFKSLTDVHTIQKFGDTLHISFKKLPGKSQWHNWQREAEGNLLAWEQIDPSIEDIFLEHMESANE
jgi:ABC-type multidrug transport system ATPase subunit